MWRNYDDAFFQMVREIIPHFPSRNPQVDFPEYSHGKQLIQDKR